MHPPLQRYGFEKTANARVPMQLKASIVKAEREVVHAMPFSRAPDEMIPCELAGEQAPCPLSDFRA
jgi:hypothetical protein